MAGTGKPSIVHDSLVGLHDKVENQGTTAKGKLSAAEFNQFVAAVEKEQSNTGNIVGNAVFGVKLPGQNAVFPNDDGIVELGSSDAGITIWTENNQRIFNFYSATVRINIAVTVNDGNQAATGETVRMEIYRGTGDSPVKTLTFQSAFNNPAQESDYHYVDFSDVVRSDITSYRVKVIGTQTELESTLNLTINSTSVYVECLNSPTSIFRVDTTTRLLEGLHYYAYGALAEGQEKILYIRVHDDVESTSSYFEQSYNINGIEHLRDFQFSENSIQNNPNLVKHGVHLIEAFCVIRQVNPENQNETVVVYTSDTVYVRFMFVNDLTDNSIYIILQNMTGSIENYTQSEICQFSLFKPLIIEGVISTDTTSDIDVRFQLKYRYQGLEGICAILNSTLKAGTTQTLVLQPEATQIGSDEPLSYNAQIYAYHTYEGESTEVDLISESGYSSQEATMTLVNNAELSPVPGAVFVINPKLHTQVNNGTIFNDKDAQQAVVQSTWDIHGNGIDGWLNNNVLRLIAGDRIEITQQNLKPFGIFKWGSGVEPSNRSIAIEFDILVSNVTDENEPIITIGYTDSNQKFKGIRFFPTMGYVFTKSAFDTKNQDFQWEENKKVHIGITITHQVECNYGDNTHKHYLNLIKVFIDGKCEREIVYQEDNPEQSWTIDDYQFPYDANIVLGGDTADLDIYSLRLYTAKALSSSDSLKNFIASKNTTQEKLEIFNRNQITYAAGTLNAGRISAELVRGIGKNVLIWYGQECKNAVTNDPFPAVTGGNGGYWGIWKYNSDGTLDDLHSGYLCRETGIKGFKSQGTTAKTYYYHNIQTKVKGYANNGEITINWKTGIDSNYITAVEGTGEDIGKIILNGGGFKNKKFTLSEGSDLIVVPDGWTSFSGLYRGTGYQVTSDSPFANKLVNKINYASSMQSHLMGGVMSYNDLHKAVVGANALQQGTNVRVTKCVQPFFFFVEDENHVDSPVFRGLCTFGSGKADDATWGYNKQTDFVMIEGASNNAPLADMRVPWDDEVERSFDDGEQDGWIYGNDNAVNIDLDKCTFVKDELDRDICNGTIENKIKKAFNYLYWHNPNILAYNGTRQNLLNNPSGLSIVKSYWTSDHYLMRYDFKTQSWVDAGFKGNTLISDTNTYYKKRKLDTVVNLENDEDYNDAVILANVDWTLTDNEITQQIINAYANHAAQDPLNADPTKHGLSKYFKIDSLLFHYAYVNYYIAGTDNCSKNTYYVFIPGDDVFELHQDDLDTIFMTDNSGNQTKPYYIDRKHPYDDNDTGHTEILYEGKDNVLFNLCEVMFGGQDNDSLSSGTTIRYMMYRVFNAMASLKGSIWNFIDSYFFAVQKYFPEVAWNEQAMVRYEYPEAIGYNPTMAPKPGRDIQPITQSIGSQLSSEMNYMKKRTIMAASYAHFGSLGGGIENIGIDECSNSFGTYATKLGDYKVKFKVKAFQYIYPSYVNGDNATSTCQRIGPNDGYFTLPQFLPSANDQVCGLQGSNFYTMVDDENGNNMGDNPFYATTFNAKGQRLKKFICHPLTNPSLDQPESGITTSVIFQGITNEDIKTFNCQEIPNVEVFDIEGCVYTNPDKLEYLIHAKQILLKDSAFDKANSQNLPINGSLEVLDLRGTPTTTTNIANCETLKTLYVSYKCTSLILNNLPNLTTIVIENEVGRVSLLQNIIINGCNKLTSVPIASNVKNVNISNCSLLTTISSGLNDYANIETFIANVGVPNLDSQDIFIGIYTNQHLMSEPNVVEIAFSNVSWSGLNGDQFDFLLSIDSLKNTSEVKKLTGKIAAATSGNPIDFSRKLKLIRKFGNVDDTASAQYLGLWVTYPKSQLSSCSVRGPLYTRQLGDYQYLAITETTANNFISLSWSVDTPSASGLEIEMDELDGILSVISGDLTTERYTNVRCNIDTFSANTPELSPGDTSTVTNRSYSRKVYLYDRQAQVGDFVYADGDYSDVYDNSRTVIGVCIFVGDTNSPSGDYVVQDAQPRLAICCNNLSAVSGYNFWGCYLASSGWNWNTNSMKWESTSTPSWPQQYQLLGHDVNENPDTFAFQLDGSTGYDIYMISRNTNNSRIHRVTTNSFSTYLNTSSCADFNAGFTGVQGENTTGIFKPFDSNTNVGTGFAFTDSDRTSRTLPTGEDWNNSDFQNILPKDSQGNFIYGEGAILNRGYMNTLAIILHRNKLLTDTRFADWFTGWTEDIGGPIPTKRGNTSEWSDLVYKMTNIKTAIQNLGIQNETYYDKYVQIYYPAASMCYAYEPTNLKEGEVLNDKFKAHNWFLPTEGQLMRIYYYFQAAFHDGETNLFEGKASIFAYAEWKSGGQFANLSSSSGYWSSTEPSQFSSWVVSFSVGSIGYNTKCSSGYVRALVAF